MPVLIWLAIAGFVTAAAFWDQLREWAQSSLADAVGRILGSDAREAFLDALAVVDKVMCSVRRSAKHLVDIIREALIKAVVLIEKNASNAFIKRMCAYVRKVVDTKEKVYRVVVEEEVPWEDLPDEARARFLRGQSQEVLQLGLGPNPTDNN